MEDKINKIEQMAVVIAAAEVQNGMRNKWLWDLSDAHLDNLARVSVSLAEKIAFFADKK